MKKKKVFKPCGIQGKRARSDLRQLLSGEKLAVKEARTAIDHVKKCDFCQVRIKNAIADAKIMVKKDVYSTSLNDTLQEAERIVRQID